MLHKKKKKKKEEVGQTNGFPVVQKCENSVRVSPDHSLISTAAVEVKEIS